ncbi:alpha/beta-hydrolase [Athelia psychrophila]|uniref:Alpha/beta-hydrolase n=1 Tax=Athelia psychrophila TaxID=1759441 RepID=A0A166FE37_9AGAM|nr:alpha/beta-hydrolase [Fibularhizoctonia sp. CBS 109695]
MDQASYKDLTTSRGVQYHYYTSAPRDSKPTLLLLHGFPSTSWDWRHQVPFFKSHGYGLIVPDLLGYGGTDKPTEPEMYKLSAIAKDIVDILDAEKVQTVISISHDWGSMAASRLYNFYPDRLTAMAFFAVPYAPPNSMTALERNAHFSKLIGFERFGYWFFMAEEGSDKLIENNWESFRSLYYPDDPTLWRTYLNPSGGVKSWLLADKKGPLPPYITESEMNHHRDLMLKCGFAGPLCWYRVLVEGITPENDKTVPAENVKLKHPVFFGAPTKDFICLAAPSIAGVEAMCTGTKVIKEYDADHWLIFSHAQVLNEDLLDWLKSL